MYTYEEVLDAYIKLKTYIYYDSTNLYMRKQLAVFETNLTDDIDFISYTYQYRNFAKTYNVDISKEGLSTYEAKLLVFTEALNRFHEAPQYFQTFLDRISTKFLPKKIEEENELSKIISNKRVSDKYVISRSAVFIDAPIEIHLVSVLWILNKGVSLDKKLFDGCLGNRLILNKDKSKVVQGSGLFKPYPKQYQKWRDDSVKVAREHLEKGENVLLLNLDIRDFFYSVRIPKAEIDGSAYKGKVKMLKSLNNLYSIFGSIHKVFTEQISKEHKIPYDFTNEVYDSEGLLVNYILPIGLLSSFVLANHYLISFDSRIVKNARPVYYGRYVDDILMVIANPILPHEDKEDSISELNFNFDTYRKWLKDSDSHDETEGLTEDDYEKLSDLEQFVMKNFNPIITLIDKPVFLGGYYRNESNSIKQDRVFKLNGFKRLYCQSSKTLLYYFDKDESALVIDKLKRDLEEKSSEFRNYNDAEGEEDFEESAYHLLYDGSDGKIRTLKDYKEDKFGLSVYLSKRIFNALRRADKISEDEAEKIVKFFRGTNALNLYTLWERVFVFLLVNNKPGAYVKFYINCSEAILQMRYQKNDKIVNKADYQNNVLEYLECANEMALSLHPKFLSEIKKIKRTYEFSFNAMKDRSSFLQHKYSPTSESSFFIKRFRQSNLIRHHYVTQPLLSYTENDRSNYQNYTDLKIPF